MAGQRLGIPLSLLGKEGEAFTPRTKCLMSSLHRKLWPLPAFCTLPFTQVKGARITGVSVLNSPIERTTLFWATRGKGNAEPAEVERRPALTPQGANGSSQPGLLKLYWLLSCLDIKITWRDPGLLVLLENAGTVAVEANSVCSWNVRRQCLFCLGAGLPCCQITNETHLL